MGLRWNVFQLNKFKLHRLFIIPGLARFGNWWTGLERFGNCLTGLGRRGQVWDLLDRFGQVWADLGRLWQRTRDFHTPSIDCRLKIESSCKSRCACYRFMTLSFKIFILWKYLES